MNRHGTAGDRARSWVTAGFLAAAALGIGRAEAEPVSGPDLARELAGNTLAGFNGALWFSEFHSPDGRIFGHNGGRPAVDACWRVRGNAVCYYYPGERPAGQDGADEFCWTFERAGAAGYKIALVGRSTGGIARRETGNSHRHTDGGRSWACEALISGRDPAGGGPRLATRAVP